MSFLYQFQDPPTAADKRTAQGLLRLRQTLAALPDRAVSDKLMIATWNIREFDSNKYGKRSRESLYYIAEIISHFDIVAIQEVNANLVALKEVQQILGHWWQFLITDVTAGTGGNSERMAFMYDARKGKFGGLSGEIVIPPQRVRGKTYQPAQQLARTPMVCGFEAGWLKFMLSTVHIYYGTSKADDPVRIKEIELLSEFLADRVKDNTAWAKNLVLMGDFNIFSTSDATFKAITKAGFFIPEQLQTLPSNVSRNKHYDQMAFISTVYDKKLMKDRLSNCRAGVINFFEAVYRDEDETVYAAEIGEDYHKNSRGNARSDRQKTNYYRQWRTFQISDHLPMWLELSIDFGEAYLEKVAAAGAK